MLEYTAFIPWLDFHMVYVRCRLRNPHAGRIYQRQHGRNQEIFPGRDRKKLIFVVCAQKLKMAFLHIFGNLPGALLPQLTHWLFAVRMIGLRIKVKVL